MSENSNWRRESLDVYRIGQLELAAQRRRARRSDDAEFFKEELTEALLDLKEATLAEDSARAMAHVEEVLLLVSELRLRSEEE
jgi:hypothetical protein